MQRDRCSICDKMLARNCGVLLQGHAVFGVANSPPFGKEGLGEIGSRRCAATSRAALAKCARNSYPRGVGRVAWLSAPSRSAMLAAPYDVITKEIPHDDHPGGV